MTEFIQNRRRPRHGSALLMALLLTMTTAALVAAYMQFSTADARLSRRMIDYQKARMAAEAGLEYGVLQLRDLIVRNQFNLGRSTAQSRLNTQVNAFYSMANPCAPYVYTTAGGTRSLRISVDTDVQQDQTITNGMACRGLMGDFQYFTITCGARNPGTGVGAVLRLRLQAVGVFLIRYAIFYENDMELFPGPTMTVSGPVHGNDRLFFGASSGLNFQDRVTSASTINVNTGKDTRTFSGPVTVEDASNVAEPFRRSSYLLDSRYNQWISEALNVWDGNVLSGVHGIHDLRPPIAPLDEPREIIERARSTNDASYLALSESEREDWLATETEKFSRRAELYIHINSAGVLRATNALGADVTSRFPAARLVTNSLLSGLPVYSKTATGNYVVSNGCIDVTQANFYDDRENKYMAPVDIYIDRFVPILDGMTNGGVEGLVYVTRDPPSSNTNRIPAVRLRNGSTISKDIGVSIVTDCPVYIEGNYNITARKTAMVAGDAVTMLSKDWQDARSALALGSRTAPSHTTNNVVIMTGNTQTIGTSYNGGVENNLRFLEDWNNKTYYYRGSIIDLWYSRMSTHQWEQTGNYYNAPNRNWGYDSIYRTLNPPGMTRVFGLEEIEWGETSWQQAAF